MPISEVANEKTSKRGVSADKKIMELLKEGIAGEMSDADYYGRLIGMAKTPHEKAILRQIRLDEHKHERILRDIYIQLTSEDPDIQPEYRPVGRRLQLEYEKSVFQELEGADFCKRIYLTFINMEIRDMLFDIFTDEQAHAIKLMSLSVNNGRIIYTDMS